MPDLVLHGPDPLCPMERCHATRRETSPAFRKPDETREFPNGKAEIVSIGDADVGRLTFQPGWRWATDVKPIAGTNSCEAPHFQYHISGRLAIRMDDGTEITAMADDVTSLPSGHDAWSWVTSPWSSSIGTPRATTPRAAEHAGGRQSGRRPPNPRPERNDRRRRR